MTWLRIFFQNANASAPDDRKKWTRSSGSGRFSWEKTSTRRCTRSSRTWLGRTPQPVIGNINSLHCHRTSCWFLEFLFIGTVSSACSDSSATASRPSSGRNCTRTFKRKRSEIARPDSFTDWRNSGHSQSTTDTPRSCTSSPSWRNSSSLSRR